MKVALVGIACNEDHYIQEWIKYHKLIGIDEVFIYQNNWRYPFENAGKDVHLIEWDGQIKQIQAYNDFKDKYLSKNGKKQNLSKYTKEEFINILRQFC